ncbi:MAG: LacI family DNA-binding transcriptional regulator [Propionibacteriaceae bacterium]|nr:LacI family DNA-binding transcriptional regulator [Propionibacteriaceae bacterium]
MDAAKPRRRATIIDVAKAARVSKSTVSLALKGSPLILPATIDKVRAAAREVGYVRNESASKLASKGQRTLGLFVRDVNEPVYGIMHRAVQAACDERGIELLSATIVGKTNPEREMKALRKLVGSGISALVVGSGTNNPEDLTLLSDLLPVVVAGRPQLIDGVVSIGNDEEGNGRSAVDILASQGHSRIAVLRIEREDSFSMGLRMAAACARIQELGLELIDLPQPSGSSADIDRALSQALGGPDRPTAILCRHDPMAMDVLRWLHTHSFTTPGDVSLFGFGGWTAGLDLIGLSTIQLAVEVVAREAVEWGERLMGEPLDEPSLLRLVPGRFLDNGSVGPPTTVR